MIELSVIIPVRNEEGNIIALHSAIVNVLNKLRLSYEIIWINDGSTDKSLDKLKQLTSAGTDGKIKVIDLAGPSGKSAAMQAGFDNAEGKTFITLDGDLQNDPEDIPSLLFELNQGYDVVCGWRYNRHDTWVRRISSKAGNIFRKIFSGEKIHDVGCMLRVYKADALKNIYLTGPYHRFLTWILSKKGCRLSEVKVSHHHRKHGQAKYNIRNRLPESLPAVFRLAFGNMNKIIKRQDKQLIKNIFLK